MGDHINWKTVLVALGTVLTLALVAVVAFGVASAPEPVFAVIRWANAIRW